MRVVQKVVHSDLIRTYHSCLLDMFSRKFAQVSRKKKKFSRKLSADALGMDSERRVACMLKR